MKKKNDIILMDFTGTYKEQQFYQEESVSWVEVQELSGCNCYCDNEAQERLEDFIRAYPVRGIHFLDSGNYHYVSLLWLKKIQGAFLSSFYLTIIQICSLRLLEDCYPVEDGRLRL